MVIDSRRFHSWLVCAEAICLTAVWATTAAAVEDDQKGAAIYQKKCAACHGKAGEGVTDHFPKPLIGERSLEALTRVIEETMPEDKADECVGEEAASVAAYIFDAFYSKDAQARVARPRIELARLTVGQYQNAVADLIGSFQAQGRWDDQRGLRGEYFNAGGFSRDKRVIDRLEAKISFDFGEGSPEKDKIEAKEFAIRWEGSILAEESGEYEFIIKTLNGARLWVNDREQPLIDAWVRSGDKVERRAAIKLLAGRAYSLRLEFYKSEKAKEKTAAIELLWKPPHLTDQPIPERNLSPNRFPQTLVIETTFPPDDRSVGYERGTTISPEWYEASTYAAIEIAGYVNAHLVELTGYNPDAADAKDRLRRFCHRFAESAFRRPLTEKQKQVFVEKHFDNAEDLKLALKKSLLLILTSPRFLYREVGGKEAGAGVIDDYDVASRLSFALWDSIPDQQLLESAAKGELKTREQILVQAERMVTDFKSRAKLRDFFHHWLKVDRIEELSKDSELFPEFNNEVVADLRVSLDLFLDDVAWSEQADFRQLLSADYLYLNGRLAKIYGANLEADAPFQRVSFDPQHRSGLLSHPFLMSGFAYHATSSPIHRGVFVARGLLGRVLRPPPEAVTPFSPESHKDLTTRQRVSLQTSPSACASCHDLINPLGFSLEHYDAIGRFRSEENGQAVDATGAYRTLDDKQVDFDGVRQLAAFLAESDEVYAAFVEQLFHHVAKQPLRAYGLNLHDDLRYYFAENGFNIKKLLVEMATTVAVPPP